ncbi:amidohydrolase family protein [Arthrobacter sp. B2a2-09]|uniref:amidohydrolase family protein n=1 Tax=Arthrobacter sp. B2a2-09 TaxID=2952822 RepID=UPI0022CDA85A|nr:amidohydrolase family protein [Arthrobacter sp. B2a2-09]MCZ9880964.1 amidohydrolase family protein [Arthrobacter sp. B2a2-09]
MTVIDAHHHLWDPGMRDYPWMSDEHAAIRRPFDTEDMRQAIAGTPVEATVLVQALGSDEETDWLLELGGADGLIAGVVGWADLTSDRIAERLHALTARTPLLKGIRHLLHDEPDPDWLLRVDVSAGLHAVRDAGLAYDLLIHSPDLPVAEQLARTVPGLTLIVDHAAKPAIAAGEWGPWRTGLRRLARHEQVYCKISGLVTEASWTGWREADIERYIHAVLEEFGADRCMFGSDWPVSLLAASYAEVFDLVDTATAALSADERQAIFGGTAAAAYNLTL